jgi:hypothetical protein
MCIVNVCFYIIFPNKDPECSASGLAGLALYCSQAVGDRRVRFDDLIKKRFDASQMSDIWDKLISTAICEFMCIAYCASSSLEPSRNS